MTNRHDVAIVGGGLVGLFSALYLARQGASVVVFEAGDPGAEASGANAGSLHLQIQYPEFVKFGEKWARDYASTLKFLAGSIDLWRGMSDDLGEDISVSTAGGIVVAKTDAQMRAIEAKSRIEAEVGVETRLLGQADLQRIAPYLSKDKIGGGFCADEGKADTLRTTPALLKAVRAAGGVVRAHTTVEGIVANNGAFRLVTTAGELQAGQVINAAGAKAARIASMLDVEVGLEGFPLQVTVSEPVAPIIPHLIYSAAGKLTLKQARNGGLIIGGGWAARVREGGGLATNPANFAANMGLAADVVPSVASARTIRSWTAWVNGTSDWRPVIGEAQSVPGFYLALFPWVGFSAAPMTGRVMADLVAGHDPTVPLKGISVLYD